MAGLAHALEDLHRLLNCRHGDLKPANILYFTENGRGILKIADLGVARFHMQETNRRHGKTTTVASTMTYEGPEAYINNRPRSRTFDCWSMGCIILEFVVWILHGPRALEGFERARKWSIDVRYSYYRPTIASIPAHAELVDVMEVHPVAHRAMKHLRENPRCAGSALEKLVNLVNEKLLKIDPAHRIKAGDLHRELQAIAEAAHDDPPFSLQVDPSIAVPAMFQDVPIDAAFEANTSTARQPSSGSRVSNDSHHGAAPPSQIGSPNY
jgi:serine/threonine protein kinase